MIEMNAHELQTILQAAVPDLAVQPLYVCLTSDGLPTEFNNPAALGYCPRGFLSLDVLLRDWLGDRWQGRGVAFVVDDLRIAADATSAAEGDADYAKELADSWITSIAAHEASHGLELDIDLEEVPEPVRQRNAEAVSAFCSEPLPVEPISWIGHDAGFVRILLHLAHRMKRLGHHVPLSKAVSFAHRDLSPIWQYQAALEPELRTLPVDLPFSEIRAATPPQKFIDLWQGDAWRWYGSKLRGKPDPAEHNYRVAELFSNLFHK